VAPEGAFLIVAKRGKEALSSMAERVHFLTSEGRQKLEKELEFLRMVRRPQVAAALKSAVDEGDLSENAGYEESKREQAFVEGRIRDIEAILGNAQLMEDCVERDIVRLGIRVTVAEDGGEAETYMIVGRAEADPFRGRISNESPLGRALMGRRAGERVRINTPGGISDFQILAVE
jgi:transcription elongation factor GreA